jgi:hypothetical protein
MVVVDRVIQVYTTDTRWIQGQMLVSMMSVASTATCAIPMNRSGGGGLVDFPAGGSGSDS